MTRDPAAKEGRGHTREPWTANFTRYDGGVEGFHIAGVERGSSYEICGFVLQKGDNPAEAEANARRIVACVNYLEGMSTELLERGNASGGQTLLAELEADRDHLRGRVKELETALIPFAEKEFSTELGGNIEGANSIVYARNNVALTIGHFRRARSALSKSPK